MMIVVEVCSYDLKPEDQVYVRRCMYHNIRLDGTNFMLRSDAMLRFYEIRPGGTILMYAWYTKAHTIMNANNALVLYILIVTNDSTEIKLLML